MKIKFLIPVMAMIFAVGMSFANVEKASDPTTDYILVNDNFVPIDMELTCSTGAYNCRVQFEENGPIYDVYGAEDPESLKKSGTDAVIELWR